MKREKNVNNDNPSLPMVYQEVVKLKEHVTENYINIKWLTKLYETLSRRQWYIVTGIIISILLQILFFILQKGV
jgi:hypothetical protein